jgi:hypothetical protein
VLRRKLVNVGFEGVVVHGRRPFGLAALARYQVFPPEFLDFVRCVVPPDRHDSLVYAVDMTAMIPG